MTEPTPVVFVVDDDVSVREALPALVRTAGWTAQACSSAEEFLAQQTPDAPTCLVLDVRLPGLDGLDLQQTIAERWAHTPVIFITGYGDVPTTVRAMKGGAAEFLTKPFADDVILEAIGEALDRSRMLRSRDVERRILQQRYQTLSRREQEVMALVVAGLLNKQVGARLGISEITVKAHRGRMMRKMAAASLPDLVTMTSRLELRDATE